MKKFLEYTLTGLFFLIGGLIAVFYSQQITDALYLRPLHFIGVAFSFYAAIGVLTFMRGFLSGVGHLSTIDGHADHMTHHRHHAAWGVMILCVTFVLWEGVRVVAGFFGSILS